jgi:hypothetical protein
MSNRSRRAFLSEVGSGMLVAGLGSTVVQELGLSRVAAAETASRLTFGALEPLVSLLQETPADRMLPLAVDWLKSGTSLETLVSAAALANARAFGGHDYTGYHTFMAFLPAYQMAGELPTERRALPVLKVMHRNSRRIHDQGFDDHDSLPTLVSGAEVKSPSEEDVRQAVRAVDLAAAEQRMAAHCGRAPAEAFDALQVAVQDDVNVHRVVLAWRAWAMLDLAGQEHALTMLRQSVRFCVDSEKHLHDRKREPSAVRSVVPRLLDEHRLLERPLGTRPAEDKWVGAMAHTVYSSSPEQAAAAVAAALAEGIDPEAVGEAISLAANLLVLHDPGRSEQNSSAEKPAGCVHGDSVGVHASDSANAWRQIARVSNARNRVASLVVGAYHTAGQSSRAQEGQFPYVQMMDEIRTTDEAALLQETQAAIEANEQARACALVQRYGEQGHPERPVFDLLLRYAVSEDGALHAEKYYRTVCEEFAATRPAFRWRQLVALARVTASEHGYPAPGYQASCELLGVS